MSEIPHDHIKRLRREKFGWAEDGTKLPNPLEQDLRQALKHLAEELYATKHHFILELIQNAEDNAYKDGDSPMLSLQLLAEDPTSTPGADGSLLLLNNELGFQPAQVQSLCSVGQSTKTKREGYIGEKGIGFKSVFQVTKRPHVFSNGYQFHFRKPEAEDDLGYIVPFWVEDVPEVLRESNARTRLLLPLIPGERESIAVQLLAIAPETILFLTKLSALHIDTGAAKRTVIRDARDGFVTLHSGESESRYFKARYVCTRPQDLLEEKRPGIDQRELSVALPLSSPDACTGRIYAFLPTERDSGLPFLVNADFLLTASREDILAGRPWNQWLRNCIAPVFTATFTKLLQHESHKYEAYRFIPVESDLRQQVADFFKPVVDAVHAALREQECVCIESGALVRPDRAWFAGKTERALLKMDDVPPGLSGFAFVAPELERWQKRLRPLRVQDFTTTDFLSVINNREWLQRRDEAWWEQAFQFLAGLKVTAAVVAQIPLLRCDDGVCRAPNASGVFLNAETSIQLPAEGPDVHLFAPSLQQRLQQNPVVWAWLTQTLRLSPLSMRAYIVNRLVPWMRAQTGDGAGARLVRATRFIFANSAALDETARTSLKSQIPWVLADGRIADSESRVGKEVVTPEALEGADGWHWLFISPSDREHFLVLTNDYVAGTSEAEKESWRKFLGECGPTRIPDPAKRELSPGQPLYVEALARCATETDGRPQLLDWACPRWLRDLVSVEATQNGIQKVTALERWLRAFPQTYDVAKFFRLSKKDHTWGNWEKLRSWSELGFVLRTKPWLKTTRGYCSPPQSFLDTSELRGFLGDSVPYAQTTLPAELLEKLGVRVRLTADVLLDLLRQMRTSESVNFDLVTRIYRRLHDSQFETSVFRAEALVYVSETTPAPWRKSGELVWQNAGPVFDEHFGYLEPVYVDHDLHGFFTQKLQVPEEPDLKQFAEVWAKLSQEEAPLLESVERRLKRVIEKLLTAQDELNGQPWWPQFRQQLRVWTTESGFEDSRNVYAPDDGFAVEIFAKCVPIAWNPTQARLFAPFLKALGCRSLAGAIRATLVGEPGESAPTVPAVLTPASKELILYLVCNAPNWKERQPLLEAILATQEVFTSAVTVDYALQDNPQMNPVRQVREAFWHVDTRRLVLKTGIEVDAWRSAAADSIAVALGGVAQRRELADAIYRLLTASPEAAHRIRRERNWSLSKEQDDWLTSAGWSRVIIEPQAEEAEPTRTRKPPQKDATQSSPPPPAQAQPPKTPPTQTTAVPQASPTDSSQASLSQSPESATPPFANPNLTPSSSQPPPGRDTPASQSGEATAEAPRIRLKSAHAEKPELRQAQARPRTRRRERPTSEQQERETQASQEERRSGLESLSQAEKTELEQRGREYATDALRTQGYQVTPMDQRSPGYDLLAKKANEVLKVEVKAHLRKASKVFVPKGEWKEYLRSKGETSTRWELWNVEFLAEDSGHRVEITRYSEIPPDAIEESGFWVDLNRCSSVAHES